MGVKFKVVDKGWEKIKREMKLLDNSYTKVGLQESPGIGDLSELLVKGVANEFGTERIPERSFVRATTDKQQLKIFSLQKKVYDDVVSGLRSVRNGLQAIGEFVQGKMVRHIDTLMTPPNALSTIARKGVNNPLVDTGEMKQSIRHVEVVK